MGKPFPQHYIHDVVVRSDSGTDNRSNGRSYQENLSRNPKMCAQVLTERGRPLGLLKLLNCRQHVG
jgi:hypothetical protein